MLLSQDRLNCLPVWVECKLHPGDLEFLKQTSAEVGSEQRREAKGSHPYPTHPQGCCSLGGREISTSTSWWWGWCWFGWTQCCLPEASPWSWWYLDQRRPFCVEVWVTPRWGGGTGRRTSGSGACWCLDRSASPLTCSNPAVVGGSDRDCGCCRLRKEYPAVIWRAWTAESHRTPWDWRNQHLLSWDRLQLF